METSTLYEFLAHSKHTWEAFPATSVKDFLGAVLVCLPFCEWLSPAAESRGHSPAAVQWLCLLQGTALGRSGAVAPELAPQHVGPSQTRYRNFVPCITRQILNHWTTREDLSLLYLSFIPYSSKLKARMTIT